MMGKLKFAIPAGSLQESTVNLFRKAGFNLLVRERSYSPIIDDPELELRLIRAQEIPRYVRDGALDAGITGRDWVIENGGGVVEAADFVYAKRSYGKVRWVLAVPQDSRIKSVKDLTGKTIATEVVNIAAKFLKDNKVRAKVEFSWGATESKPPELADAIIEITETGSSLKASNLRIVAEVLESTTVIIANPAAWRDGFKKRKIENISMLLKGALDAEFKAGLKMNVPADKVDKLLKLLPALKKPTISHLTDSKWVALETIVDKNAVKDLIHKLKGAGAEGILEYPLNKIIY